MRRNMVLELLSLSIINLLPDATNPATTSLAPTSAENATSTAAPAVSVDTDDAGAVNIPISAPLHTTNATLARIREQGGTREKEDNGAGVGITNRPQEVFRALFTPTSAPLHTTNATLAGIREQGGTREEEDNGAGVGITNRPQGVFRAPFKGQQILHYMYLDQVPSSSETHAGEEEPEHASGK